ncbi:MAG: ABC transporter permease [Nitrososphaerales archaeon]
MNYIIRRILISIGILLIVVNLDFILPRLVPGNAAELDTSGGIGQVNQISILESRYGLNKPILDQYYIYMHGIFASWPPNLGTSFQYFPEQVSTLIAGRIGWTLLLIFTSFALSIIIVYYMAATTSTRRGGKFEITSLYFSISTHAIPIYWFALVMLWAFAVASGWFPVFGSVDPNLTFGTSAYFASVIWHSVLPVVALTLSLIGENYLVLRGSMQEVLQSDYVIAAKSRGLKARIIATRYILRNSLLPLVSILTFSLSGLISRVVLVEVVFGYPGLGDLIVDAILNHDYPVLEGAFFVLTLMVVVGGLIGDILLVRLDPKLRITSN